LAALQEPAAEAGAAAAGGAPKGVRSITAYFAHQGVTRSTGHQLAKPSNPPPGASASASGCDSDDTATEGSTAPPAATTRLQHLETVVQAMQMENARLQAHSNEAQRAIREAQGLRSQLKAAEGEAGRWRAEAEALRAQAERADRERTDVEAGWRAAAHNFTRLHREWALRGAAEARRQLNDRQMRIGRLVGQREGHGWAEGWEPGEEFAALLQQELQLRTRREELERYAKDVAKRNASRRKTSATSPAGVTGVGAGAAAAGLATPGAAGKAAAGGKTGKSTSPFSVTIGTSSSFETEEGEEADPEFNSEASVLGLTTPRGGSLLPVAGGAAGAANAMDPLAELDLLESEERIKAAVAAIKRDEAALALKKAQLEAERALIVMETRRQRAETASLFRHMPVIGDRYQLYSLLGKGGFSEVWKAMDLLEVRDVAVKVHQLSPSWSEEKKALYVKHALREHDIQKQLVHPHVVRLHAVISINDDSFATVLEYCRGGDLDRLLKQVGYLPEREARALIIQVLSALRYFSGYTSPWPQPEAIPPALEGSNASGAPSSSSNGAASGAGANPPPESADTPRRRIIHYDLKPANILFDDYRNAKLTDFGLSKIIEDVEGADGETSLELTSQGAGTYWYLPPECFLEGNVRISNKVDVWSCGVIFYQMLYGRRPFGEGKTQEQMLASGSVFQETRMGPQFPAKPLVSAEAKKFITRCLTYQRELRPDVLNICEDPYLRMKMKP
jgi:tousled-like kinase